MGEIDSLSASCGVLQELWSVIGCLFGRTCSVLSLGFSSGELQDEALVGRIDSRMRTTRYGSVVMRALRIEAAVTRNLINVSGDGNALGADGLVEAISTIKKAMCIA